MINDGVTKLTKVAGMSRQAYYKWHHRQPTVHKLQGREILTLIKRLEEEHKFIVGYDKMMRLINLDQQLPYRVNKKRSQRTMSKYGINDYRQPKRKRVQKRQNHEAKNILKRQFKVLVTDTTELTYGVRLHKVRLHVVLDPYQRRPQKEQCKHKSRKLY